MSDEGAPPPERLTKGDEIVEVPTATAGVTARRVTTQSMLDRYFVRDLISRRQYDAGARLYATWWAAGRRVCRVGAGAMRVDGGGAREMSEREAIAHSRYAAALRAVGPELSAVLVAVVICEEPAGEWARGRGYHQTVGPAVLGMALDALARHYWGEADGRDTKCG